MTLPPDFCAFILTHKRPHRVLTYKTLREAGYTGPIRLLVDDKDETLPEYRRRYGDEVVVFSKREAARLFDVCDNFQERRGVVYARNACFDVAESLGFRDFVQLDDDYTKFEFRFDSQLQYGWAKLTRRLDDVFAALARFRRESGAACVAMAQCGDFIGGSESPKAQSVQCWRKAMNVMFCGMDSRFQFPGRINEDVCAYVGEAATGKLFLTTNQVVVQQVLTQQNAGGMTELYLDAGTYVKSFYSVLLRPDCVSVAALQSDVPRVHHRVSWTHTAPYIVPESVRKSLAEEARGVAR